jgi:uncharacterized protein (DUF2235 family)
MSKNIAICCDGTSSQFEDNNTNVVYFFQAIERNTRRQLAFYDPGVGTVGALGWRVGKEVGKALGRAFGYGIRNNIEDGYRFLMNNYEEGDNVFIFGFSRGAFTARSLVAMLHDIGLLYPHNENLIPYASERFLKQSRRQIDAAFKETFARECKPYFIGVWDTVGSIGWFLPLRQFRDKALSPDVTYAYHAVSIDERRSKFTPTLWDETNLNSQQTVQQCWFAGVHGDVGGGYLERSLAKITLKWMLAKAEQAGLMIKQDALRAIDLNPLGQLHQSYKGSWKLLGEHVRQIPANATIHDSVWERCRGYVGYEPENLPTFCCNTTHER